MSTIIRGTAGTVSRRKWAARLAWFVLLWGAGVTAVASFAWLIRIVLAP